MSEARARGIRVLLTPTGPAPDWATLAGNGVDYPSPTRFRRFMTAAGRQFGSRVSYWSIWNEPNHPQFLGPQYRRGKPYSPGLYRKLFWAAHRALDRAGRAGAIRRAMPVYLTEFGIQSRPDPVYGVSWTRQEEYRAIGERLAWNAGRVRAISQYLMRDDLPRSGRNRYGGFESGLRTSSGRKKLSYRGFRLPLVARRSGGSVKLWGHVWPHDGRERVVIEYRRRGGSWRRLKSKGTGGRGYFATSTRYRSGRSYRVRWRAPDGVNYAGSPTRSISWP